MRSRGRVQRGHRSARTPRTRLSSSSASSPARIRPMERLGSARAAKLGGRMTSQQLLFAFTIGTAALALWSYVRWPGVAPATMNGAILRVVLAVALLHGSLGMLERGIDAVPSLAMVLIVGVVVPVL